MAADAAESRALFVGNLRIGADATTEADLTAHFARFGVVEATTVATHRGSSRSRGFGFVRFELPAAAATALATEGQWVRGQPLALKVALRYEAEHVKPVRVRRRVRVCAPGIVWMENFFTAEEQLELADLALRAGRADGQPPRVTEKGFLAAAAAAEPPPAAEAEPAAAAEADATAEADGGEGGGGPSSGPSFYTPSYESEGGARHELKLSMYTLGRHWDCRRRLYTERRTDHDGLPVAPLPSLFIDAAQKALAAVRERLGGGADAEWAVCQPDVAIVNLYDRSGNLGLHQDRDEDEASIRAGRPVVSFSFGDAAVFEYIDPSVLEGALEQARARVEEARGGVEEERGGVDEELRRPADGDADGDVRLSAAELAALPRRSVKLGSGDVLVFGGPSRLIYHSITRVIPHTAIVGGRTGRPWNTLGLTRGRLNITLRQSQP